MNNFNPYGANQFFQPQQYFLQPQGTIYMISTSNEINNVPVGQGVSAAICLNENLFYLKSLQNGVPVIIGYKLSPIENGDSKGMVDSTNQNQGTDLEKRLVQILDSYDDRLKKIEQKMGDNNDKGGKPEWRL